VIAPLGSGRLVLLPRREDAPVNGFDSAGYLAARASAARALREIEVEAAELGLGSLAGLAGWRAAQFEGWTPFWEMPDSAFRLPWTPPEIPPGCYEASFGWVHVRPGCRCPLRRDRR
jgi:hypothetical protein